MPRHKLVGIGASAVLTLAVAALPFTPTQAATPATGQASQGWALTHTQALHINGSLLGPASAAKPLTISVALPMRNTSGLNADIISRSNPDSAKYGDFMTPSQVRATYGPSLATVNAVRSYLTSQGFTGISVASNRMLVNGTATVAQVDRAFHTSIDRYLADGHQVYANSLPAMVPAALDGKVSAVLGLSDFSMTMPHTVKAPSVTAAAPKSVVRTEPAAATGKAPVGTPVTSGFDAKQLQLVYEATKLPQANKTEVAVIAAGDMTQIIKNLRFAEMKEGFKKVKVNVVYTAPKAAIVFSNPLSGNAEWDLDTQLSTMMAGYVKRLDIYAISTFTDSDVARGINKFVSDDKAKAGSASLGECDALAYLDGAMVTTDGMIAQGALQGQSFFASTGDNGSFCPVGTSTGAPGGGPGDSWPADGEYTTGVGGTTLIADKDGHTSREIAWVGGGGGISQYATAAPWTYQVNLAAQQEIYNNEGGRAVPDISAVADSNTGVLIYTDGTKPEEIGGTSVSAPLIMGLWARIDGAHNNRLGLASYRMYKLYANINPATVEPGLVPTYVPALMPKNVKAFRDVIIGTDGTNQAKPGYDYTSGLGTLLALPASKLLGPTPKK